MTSRYSGERTSKSGCGPGLPGRLTSNPAACGRPKIAWIALRVGSTSVTTTISRWRPVSTKRRVPRLALKSKNGPIRSPLALRCSVAVVHRSVSRRTQWRPAEGTTPTRASERVSQRFTSVPTRVACSPKICRLRPVDDGEEAMADLCALRLPDLRAEPNRLRGLVDDFEVADRQPDGEDVAARADPVVDRGEEPAAQVRVALAVGVEQSPLIAGAPGSQARKMVSSILTPRPFACGSEAGRMPTSELRNGRSVSVTVGAGSSTPGERSSSNRVQISRTGSTSARALKSGRNVSKSKRVLRLILPGVRPRGLPAALRSAVRISSKSR